MSEDGGVGHFIKDESNSKGFFTHTKKMIDLVKGDKVRKEF